MINKYNKEDGAVTTTLLKQWEDETIEMVKEDKTSKIWLFRDILRDYNTTNTFIGKDRTLDDSKFREYFNDLWYNI
jgi:hypothetical protein